MNNDLISRQAAINKILGQPPEPHYPSWYAEQIKELPSAQPTFDARDTQYNLPIGTDLISRQAMIEAIENNDNFVGGSYDIIKVVKSLPPAEPELIKCDYVKACNEVTMNKTFSAWRYLAMLDDFEEFGYVLVKRRG